MVRRQMRFAAVLVVVVLALTGFSTSSHGGKSGKSRSSGSSGGGGCSNSKKSNGSYHDYDDDYDDYDSSSGSSGGSSNATPSPTASDAPEIRVIRCAQPKKGKRKAVTTSTIEIRSTVYGTQTYDVDVTFVDAKGLTVDTGEATVELDYDETRTLSVKMDSPRLVSRVKRCLVTAEPM
ncbi:hypothetical protein ABZY45_07425 [Streptomyces sp. NPDC006516]|uniref:hypothetical protein n=1 Tax=Streptomyces sp. NPDC006516 TaxID=3154309 RepID=UPI0033AAC05E